MNMSHDSTILQSQIGQRLKQTYAVEILSRQLNPNPMPPLLKDIKNPRTLHLTCWFMSKVFFDKSHIKNILFGCREL